MTVFLWDKSNPSNNDAADSTIDWREGMRPSAVNDSARAMMTALAKWRDDIAGMLSGGGSASAFTVSTNQNTSGTLYDGFRVSFKVPAANTGAVTLSVDGSTAKPLRIAPSVECPPALFNAGGVYAAVYVAATQEWLLEGISNPAGTVPTGVVEDYMFASAPSGWIMHAEGGTIGNGASAATVRANADTWNLFNGLWTTFPSLTVSPGGRGASAAADFAANKVITLPGIAGRALVAPDLSGAVLGSVKTLGSSFGAPTHALTEAQNGPHTHVDSGHQHQEESWWASGGYVYSTAGAGTMGVHSQMTATGYANIQPSGSGSPHNNLQPTFVVSKIIKL